MMILESHQLLKHYKWPNRHVQQVARRHHTFSFPRHVEMMLLGSKTDAPTFDDKLKLNVVTQIVAWSGVKINSMRCPVHLVHFAKTKTDWFIRIMRNQEHLGEEFSGFGLIWKSTLSITTFPFTTIGNSKQDIPNVSPVDKKIPVVINTTKQ